MVSRRILATLALGASLLAFCVIELGAFTRLIDAGLGCPDWPGCYGHFMIPTHPLAQAALNNQFPTSPFVAYKAWAEMIHRYFVGGLSTFILVIIGFIFSKKALRTRTNITLSILLILVLCYQILLGKWTVTLKLVPIVVTQHLLGGFFILSILWLIYLVNRSRNLAVPGRELFISGNGHPTLDASQHPGRRNLTLLKAITLISLVVLILQILLGAWTSTNYAAFSCPDFPFCNIDNFKGWAFSEAFRLFSPIGVNYEGGVLSEAARQTIQSIHRIGALVVTICIASLVCYAFLICNIRTGHLKLLGLIIGLLILQLCLGITNALFNLPLISAIAHNGVAVVLLLSLMTFFYYLSQPNELVAE